MVDLPGLEVDVEEARAWVRYHFEGMSALLEQVSARLDDLGAARLLVSPEQVAERGLVDLTLDHTGRLVSQGESEELARAALVALSRRGARTFLVEDELGRRSDPVRLTDDAFFIGEAVLRSEPLHGDCATAAELLRRGSSGYPCDALVSTETQDRLGLHHGADLAEGSVARLAASVTAVLTSVWDDETYVLLCDDRDGPPA